MPILTPSGPPEPSAPPAPEPPVWALIYDRSSAGGSTSVLQRHQLRASGVALAGGAADAQIRPVMAQTRATARMIRDNIYGVQSFVESQALDGPYTTEAVEIEALLSVSGRPANAARAALRLTAPDGSQQTLINGVDMTVRQAVGVYRLVTIFPAPGEWRWRWFFHRPTSSIAAGRIQVYGPPMIDAAAPDKPILPLDWSSTRVDFSTTTAGF